MLPGVPKTLSPSAPHDLTVVVLSWNTRDLTLRALRAIPAACAPFRAKAICVDNASGDGSASAARAALPDGLVIENAYNLGFAKGNNVALPYVEGRAVCFLNSDTEASPGSLAALLSYLDARPSVGIVAPPLVGEDGTRLRTAWGIATVPNLLHLYTPLGWLGFGAWETARVRTRSGPATASGPVESVTGACMMVRADLCRALGGFDPGYPFYYEDQDICWRSRRAGAEVHLAGEGPAVLHVGGASSKKAKGAMSIAHVRGMLRLQRKRLTPLQFALFAPALKVGLLMRRTADLALAPIRYTSRLARGQRSRGSRGLKTAAERLRLYDRDLRMLLRSWGD